jgi:hypothetical protein
VLFADLPGYLDNVSHGKKGRYWVVLNQERRGGRTALVKHLAGVRLDVNVVEVEVLTMAKGVTLSEVT